MPTDKLRSRFDNFLVAVWRHLNLPPPDPIQIAIARALQFGPRRLIIQAFRGVGKSYITGTFCVWLLYNNPDLKVLILSASQDKASDQSQFMLRLIQEIPWLQHLEPGPEQRRSMLAFDVKGAGVSQSPSVRSRGITSTITGGRADIIVADDIETPDNSMTQVMREKIREKVKELDNIIKPEASSRIIYLGTPQLEDTLYEVLPERGYTGLVWPARYPKPDQREHYGVKLAPDVAKSLDADPSLAGKPTEGRRFGEFVLQEKELSNGRTGFTLQYMLDPSLSDVDRFPLKLKDLVVMPLNPELAPEKVIWAADPALVLNELPNVGLRGDKYHRPMGFNGMRDADGRVIWQPYTGAVMAIDPSGRGQDETGYCIAKFLNSTIFVPACGGFTGGHTEETLQALAMLAQKHQVKYIIVESNFGDGMWSKLFTSVLQKVYPCTIEDVKAPNNLFKEARIIDVLEPVMAQHRLVIDPSVVQQDFNSTQSLPSEKALKYQLFYQLTRISRIKGSLLHDDRLDALAWAVWYWVQHMASDQEVRMKATEEAWMRRQMDKFMSHCLGSKPKPLTWMH